MNDPMQPDPDATMPLPATPRETAEIRAEATLDDRATLEFAGTLDHVPDPGATTDNASVIAAQLGGVKKKRHELPNVPGYEISGVLGRGGMGVVYKARQARLNRMVALKMVLAGAHASPEQLARFDQEARAVARLQHPNIVQIYDIGELDGLPYFSLEFVEGGTLEKHIGGKPQPAQAAAEIVETLARAMAFAHEQNIIHRDLKPANILLAGAAAARPGTGSVSLEPGKTLTLPGGPSLMPKITDFGLAKAVEEGGTAQTASGTIMGTPSYMAPEQARGDIATIGPLCDLYSLGAIFYELLTGRPPFQGATILDTLDQVRNREPVPPTSLLPGVPVDLETICLKCLQKEPAKRYMSCAALADDLRRFLTGEPIQARPVSSAERAWRWCRRNPWVAGLSAASGLLLVCIAAGSAWTAYTVLQKNAVIEDEKGKAVTAAEEAIKSETEAILARKQAELEADVANKQAGVALGAIQKFLAAVNSQLGETPGTQNLKQQLLNTALTALKEVSDRAEKSTTTTIGATRFFAIVLQGDLYRDLGQNDKATVEYLKAYELAKERMRIKKGTDFARRNLASITMKLGDMDREVSRDMVKAAARYDEALALWKDIEANPKADENGEGMLSRAEVSEGIAGMTLFVATTFYRLGDPVRAAPYYREALAARRKLLEADPNDVTKRLNVAESLLPVAMLSFRLGEPATTAAAGYAETQGMLEKLLQEKPKQMLKVKVDVGRACLLHGDFRLMSGDTSRAKAEYERALALYQEMRAADPKQFFFQWNVGNTHYRLGSVALRAGDAAEARKQFENCLAVREQLAAKDKGTARRQMEYMLVLAHVGKHAEAAAIAKKILAGKLDAELLLDVARCYAWCGEAVPSDPAARDRYRKDAVDAIDKAIRLGYRDKVYLNTEADLDPLRDHLAFARLVSSLSGEAGKQP